MKRIIFFLMLAVLSLDVLAGCPCQESKADDLAAEIESSIASTAQIEEKMDSRGFFRRIFLGGDLESGKELKQIVEESKPKLEQLKKECNSCAKAEELEEKLEQLEIRAIMEINMRGLFGWFRS